MLHCGVILVFLTVELGLGPVRSRDMGMDTGRDLGCHSSKGAADGTAVAEERGRYEVLLR